MPLLPGLVTFSGLTPGEELEFPFPPPGVGAVGGSTLSFCGFLISTSAGYSESPSPSSSIIGSSSMASSLSIPSKSG